MNNKVFRGNEYNGKLIKVWDCSGCVGSGGKTRDPAKSNTNVTIDKFVFLPMMVIMMLMMMVRIDNKNGAKKANIMAHYIWKSQNPFFCCFFKLRAQWKTCEGFLRTN